MQDYCERCEEFLGLKIEALDKSNFIIRFSLDEDKVCMVKLKTSRKEGEKAFEIVECEPNIEFEAIENALNETKELNGFVVALRKKFKANL